MSELSAPQSVAEVEHLVKRLYQPGPASVIVRINNQLQKLQLSEDGWKLADALMASDDANVRFFAALTFTVKLNNDGPSLDAETAQSVLARLIYWLVRFVRQGDSKLVCRKLCSTLTTYFLQSPQPWQSPLLNLAMSFYQGDAVSVEAMKDSNIDMSALLPTLEAPQLTVLFWFAAVLAEEVGRIDVNAQAHARQHSQMEQVVRDASALMAWSFQQCQSGAFAALRAEALRTFLTWINYAQPIWPRKPEPLQHLRNLIGPAAECLLDKDLFQDALDIFRDILESYTSFFLPEHMQMLARVIYEHVRPALLRALFDRESDGQHVLYGQFVIAFGCANIQQIVEEPANELASKAIVRVHLDIIVAEGYPGDDDQLSTQSIEFWNTYIEYVNDVLFSKDSEDPDPTWLPEAKSTLKQAFQLLWKKTITPPGSVAQEWGEDERDGFKEFRMDTADLFLSIFVLLPKEMLEPLVDLTIRSLELKNWHAVEASLFCFNTLADNVLEDPANEEGIQRVFGSTLFREISDFTIDLPPQIRRTAIDLLGSYGPYIERHAEFLPDALRFLFASLEVPTLANGAGKSISSLCSACRASLTGELPGFLEQYQRFLDSGASDAYTKNKVIGAIACIIQAMSPESTKAQPLLALLKYVEVDIESARRYAASGEEELAEIAGVTALECLASIGKGMQVPDDVPIDVYDDGERTHAVPNFWDTEQGRGIQQRITGCFSALEIVGTYGTAIDAVCQVLRSGYAETEPGPFVLPPSVTVSLLQQCSIQTPQLETVLSTASKLIAQHSVQLSSNRIDAEVDMMHRCVISFVQALGHSKEDPAVSMACIDFCNRMMPEHAHVLFARVESSTLRFFLSAITGPDSTPKRSACEFSAKLFSTKHLTSRSIAASPGLQARYDEVVAGYGSSFAYCLMLEVGGRALRSELDFLCEPLKALLLNQAKAQTWLQEGLVSGRFPSSKVSADDKARFMKQLVTVQSDGKKVKEVVKAFWAACRGTVISYGS